MFQKLWITRQCCKDDATGQKKPCNRHLDVDVVGRGKYHNLWRQKNLGSHGGNVKIVTYQRSCKVSNNNNMVFRNVAL